MREYRRVVRTIMYAWCVVCTVMVFVAAVQHGVWVSVWVSDERSLIVALMLAVDSAVVAVVFGALTHSESTHPIPDEMWAVTRTTVSLIMFLAASLLTALCAGTALGAGVTILIRS